MFSNTTGLQDASAINNWNIKSNANFNKMFNSSPTIQNLLKYLAHGIIMEPLFLTKLGD